MSNNIVLRPARKEDLQALWSLCLNVFPEVKGSSFDEFSELWYYRWGSPFRTGQDLLGWVLESEPGNIKGFISYIPLMLRVGHDLFRANSVSTWVVDPSASSHSLDLFRAFGKFDRDVCLLDTTANKIASLMCARLKMRPVGVSGYRRRLFWVIDPQVFFGVKGYFESDNLIINIVFRLVKYIIARLLKVYLWLKGHRITCGPSQLQFLPVEKFGPEFDQFWDKIKIDLGIVHERTSQFMNWRHFNLPCLKGTAFSFECKDKNGDILGYIMLKTCGRGEGGEHRINITDILFLGERNDVFRFMMAKAYEFACKRSAATLEFFGFNTNLMNSLLCFKPIMREIDHTTYWFKAANKISETRFWVSGVDGDLNL